MTNTCTNTCATNTKSTYSLTTLREYDSTLDAKEINIKFDLSHLDSPNSPQTTTTLMMSISTQLSHTEIAPHGKSLIFRLFLEALSRQLAVVKVSQSTKYIEIDATSALVNDGLSPLGTKGDVDVIRLGSGHHTPIRLDGKISVICILGFPPLISESDVVPYRSRTL
jgi:hypothetical protein